MRLRVELREEGCGRAVGQPGGPSKTKISHPDHAGRNFPLLGVFRHGVARRSFLHLQRAEITRDTPKCQPVGWNPQTFSTLLRRAGHCGMPRGARWSCSCSDCERSAP
jgi:hypothetical protein